MTAKLGALEAARTQKGHPGRRLLAELAPEEVKPARQAVTSE